MRPSARRDGSLPYVPSLSPGIGTTLTLCTHREHQQDAGFHDVVNRTESETVRIPLADLNASGIHHRLGFTPQAVTQQAVIDVPSAGAGVWRVEGR